MNADHAPDSEFVTRLEWELASALRRQQAFNGTSSAWRRVRFRLGATLALAAVSIFIGGAGTYAAIHITDRQAAALYIARGEALLEIARTRLEPFTRERSRMQSLVQQGVASERELRQLEAQCLDAQAEVEVRTLDLAETRITGKEPNDALSAPLVNGRDFVTERLVARRLPLQRRLELMIDQARRSRELVEAGRASARELTAAQANVAAAEQEVGGLAKRVALRAAFLAKQLSAAEVELKDMRLAAVGARETAVRQADVLAEQHKRFTLLAERGLVSHAEVQAVEVERRTIEARVQLADLELRILDQKLRDVSERK
jgi:multidrug resistance efflux pump